MQTRTISNILAVVATAFVCFGLASAPAHATEPDPIDIVQIGEQFPVCNDPVLNLSVALADPQMPEPPDAAALQEEVDGGWVTLPHMAGDFFDEVLGNSGVVYLFREFIPGETSNLRVIVYAHEGKEFPVWSETVNLDCTDEPTETAAPTQGVTEEVASTPTPTATALVTGPMVETDMPDRGQAYPTWVQLGIGLAVGLLAALIVLGLAGVKAVSLRRRD